MLQLENPFEQSSEGTPRLQGLILSSFFSFGNSACSSIELTEIKDVPGLGKSPRRASEAVLKDA